MRLSRKSWVFGIVLLMALGFAGCGGSDNVYYTAEIYSHQASDGDIAFDSILASYTITNGPSTLFFGIDDGSVNALEYRAFLDFPLDGSTGQDVVPLGARIRSASLLVRIVSVEFASPVPTLLDLVTYTPGALGVADYNSAPLTYAGGGDATRSFDIVGSDVGRDVAIDVTSLMQEIQSRGYSDFQVRFLLDFSEIAGFVEIDDPPAVLATAPLLIVQYE